MLRKIIAALIIVTALLSVAHADDNKKEIARETWIGLKAPLESGEFFRASIPYLNEYNTKKGKPLVTFDEMQPRYRAAGKAIFELYVDTLSEVCSLDELKFQKRLFETRVGKDILQAMVATMTSPTPVKNQPQRSYSESEKAEFMRVANQNQPLLAKLNEKISQVNQVAQSKAMEMLKNGQFGESASQKEHESTMPSQETPPK